MPGDRIVDVASALQSPDPEFDVRTQNKTFPTQGLNSGEADLLNRNLNEILTGFDSSVVLDLFQARSKDIALTSAFAKQVFDEKRFGGIHAADNEIGFDILRPGHIRVQTADDDAHTGGSNGDPVNDWYFEPAATGWEDWIGDGTSANNYTFGEDQVSVVFGFIDQDTSTEISGIDVDTFGRNADLIPQDLNDMKLKDNENNLKVKPLPTMIGQENDEVYVRVRADKTKESQPRLLGVTFGLGTFLNSRDY